MEDVRIETLRNEDIASVFYHDKCDKYDYLISVGCGVISGLVDVFLVGAPGDSKLQSWTDAQVDKVVMGFAKITGWNPRAGQADNVKSAIGFLERKFQVNYDQRHTGDVGGAFEMSTKNHHMKSLAHSPDIIGLFFSILNQFTSTATFLSDGQMITIKTDTYELQGNTFLSKLFCGIVNWIGHIMSDVAGSSGAKGRGNGIVIPFYELFQLCNFGKFQVEGERRTLAQVATKVFESGYDARFGLAMSIPVVLCDLSIKLMWAIKKHFYHKRPWNECIPSKQYADLRMMLILGDGTLCVIDLVDAGVRSGGEVVTLFLRLNIIAWFRLITLVLKEVCIRYGISSAMQRYLEAFKRVNEALNVYLAELKEIDIEQYKREVDSYHKLTSKLEMADTEEKMNRMLKTEFVSMGIQLPYKGEFNDFMNDKNAVLEFK